MEAKAARKQEVEKLQFDSKNAEKIIVERKQMVEHELGHI
jgi:hypothetical protein